MMLLHRHELSNQWEDFDKAIVYLTELILLPPISWLQNGPMFPYSLYLFANSLTMRSSVSKQPDDVIYATKLLTHLRDQPFAISFFSRSDITTSLVGALAIQVKLEAGNVMQNIRDMAVLSCQLLTSETSDVDTTHAILLTCSVVKSRIRPLVPDQPLDELVEFLRVARKHRPDLLECRIAFAESLWCRYAISCGNDDYEELTTVLDEILTYPSAGNTQDESVAEAQRHARGLFTGLAMLRSFAYPSPEYLEVAIYRTRIDFDSTSRDHSSFVWDPEALAEHRFHYFDSTEGLPVPAGESSGNLPLSRQVSRQLQQLLLVRARVRSGI
jgi:hypothetical protein